jgi:nucleoside-diphosphate-sugar epimerase
MPSAPGRPEIAGQIYQQGLLALASMPALRALAGQSVCVAGCTGLIGTVVIRILGLANAGILRANPVSVYGVARRVPELGIDLPGVRFIAASVADADIRELMPPCRFTIYIAGVASDYITRISQVIESQFVGLQNFLSHASPDHRLVYISSVRVYGRNQKGIITEDSQAEVVPMHLDNIYDCHKRFCESLCLYHAQAAACQPVVARITNVYGPLVALRAETAITDFVRQAVVNRNIVLTGHPDSCRNWCSVLDIAQGLLKALIVGTSGRPYNIGSREHITTRHMAEMVAAELPYSVGIEWPGDGVRLSRQEVSVERAEREIGYLPQFSFADLAPITVAETIRGLGLNVE